MHEWTSQVMRRAHKHTVIVDQAEALFARSDTGEWERMATFAQSKDVQCLFIVQDCTGSAFMPSMKVWKHRVWIRPPGREFVRAVANRWNVKWTDDLNMQLEGLTNLWEVAKILEWTTVHSRGDASTNKFMAWQRAMGFRSLQSLHSSSRLDGLTVREKQEWYTRVSKCTEEVHGMHAHLLSIRPGGTAAQKRVRTVLQMEYAAATLSDVNVWHRPALPQLDRELEDVRVSTLVSLARRVRSSWTTDAATKNKRVQVKAPPYVHMASAIVRERMYPSPHNVHATTDIRGLDARYDTLVKTGTAWGAKALHPPTTDVDVEPGILKRYRSYFIIIRFMERAWRRLKT
jgi:hypothetical protein